MSAEETKFQEEAATGATSPRRPEGGSPGHAAPGDESSPGAGGADVPPVDPAAEPRVLDEDAELAETEVIDAEPEAPADPVADAEARAAEYLALAQRKQAEFENFRKRMQAQVGAAEARGVAKAAKALLAPLDHLGLALEAGGEHDVDEQWLKAVASVQDELRGALSRLGVEHFDPHGEAFDPTLHEAMATQPVEGAEPGTVAITYQPGYRLGDAVLRPARVVVAQ